MNINIKEVKDLYENIDDIKSVTGTIGISGLMKTNDYNELVEQLVGEYLEKQ